MSRRPTLGEQLRIWVFSLACCLAVGCTEEGGDGRAVGKGPEWQAQLETRIGSLDDPDQSLTTVGQVVLGPDGELFISQPREAEVRVYDVEGTLLRTIGRRGEGPGEFGQIGFAGLMGDTLYVTDIGRVSFFSLEGDFLGARTLSSEMIRGAQVTYAPFAPQVFIPLSDGTALVRPGVFSPSAPPSNEPGVSESHIRVPFYRTDSVSAVLDTVAWQEFGRTSVGVMRSGTLFRFSSPFDDSPLLAPFHDGTGLVVVHRGTDVNREDVGFLVIGLDPDGDTLFVRPMPYGSVPVDAEYLKEHVRQTQVIPRDHPDAPDSEVVETELRRAGLVPSIRVPVKALFVGQDGSIWLQRDGRSGDAALWQVLALDGEVAGVVRLPSDAVVVAAKEETVVTLELDEFDVPYVVRYRLNRGH